MRAAPLARSAFVVWLASAGALAQPVANDHFRRSTDQPVDQAYTARIRQYTTDPSLGSPLVDYLPASKSVPAPDKVLGDIAGAPNRLPYTADVNRYMRMLAAASPRVKVFDIGKSEEGRQMIAVAIASRPLIDGLDANRERLARLADPRRLEMNDDKAEALISQSVPVYYITGAIHSIETGAPTALMELAYRLAVDDSPYVKHIRNNVITLITPIVETDGRDREVDVYNWHRAHPGANWPPLVYWGHYVAHDNNRDAMTLTLNLTRNVLDTYLGWHAQVLHDLHESVPFLYDDTIGDGPYNAWLDPILTNEWQMIGWQNVAEMTRMGMPGVFAHGDFDTWTPGYLMFIAANHNGISRLYETFGNHGADTLDRELQPDEYARTWYRQNPPLPKVKWSQRDNNNYEETGLLVSLDYFARHNRRFLENFWLKSKRAIQKPEHAGPAAYVLPGDEVRGDNQARLLHLLQLQGCEVSIADKAFSVTVANAEKGTDDKGHVQRFPAGSFIVRMDQPYSRVADMLLDYQYWNPDDPQKHPYDDTGWTLGELFNVAVARVTDRKVLKVPMHIVNRAVATVGGVEGLGRIFVVDNRAQPDLIRLRYRLRNADMAAVEQGFDLDGERFHAGSLVIRNVNAAELRRAADDLGLRIRAVSRAPRVASHPVRAARIAIMHTWLETQTEGWWRQAFDKLGIPYDYISTQDAASQSNLARRYDVVIFAPVGDYYDAKTLVNGMPMTGNPLPWRKTRLTPNLGRIDATDDMRPGLGFAGLEHLRRFVDAGGVLITAQDTSQLMISEGFVPGVSVVPRDALNVHGTVVAGRIADAGSPLAYGYGDSLSVYSESGLSFALSNFANGDGTHRPRDTRPTGRGTRDEHDLVQGRAPVARPVVPKAEPWEALPLTAEQQRNPIFVIPAAKRPRTVLRFADADNLLVSGLLDNGGEMA
ncbi:MAG: M14 family zinc carboxypeptidase, partial [Gammaproteobacteria bacterium]